MLVSSDSTAANELSEGLLVRSRTRARVRVKCERGQMSCFGLARLQVRGTKRVHQVSKRYRKYRVYRVYREYREYKSRGL